MTKNGETHIKALYESVGRGFESLPSHQEKLEHICVLVFLFVCTMEGARTGRRRAAPQAISPVGCCLARGSHPIGMSNVEAVRECREIERFHGFFVFSAWHAGSFAPCPKTAPFPEKLHNPREHFRTKTAEKRSRGLLLFCAFTPSHPAFAAGGTPAQTSPQARAHS